MFRKIIVASDLSASSDAVVSSLHNFKSLGVDEVYLFYACGIKHLAPIAELIKSSVEPGLIRQLRMIKDQGFNATLEIVPGIPSEELKRVAKESDCSLIVIGSHGQSAASHVLFRFGSVTSEVLHSHEKPLLMIRTAAVQGDRINKVEGLNKKLNERILFPSDFSDISLRAYFYVEKLVEDGCKNVTLLHVQDKALIEKHLAHKLDEFNRIDTERLELRKKELISRGATDVQIKIIYGIPVKEILSESKAGYSLVVMGSQGRGFFHEIFIGSVSHNIARSADVSLLLIPAVDR